MRMFVWCFFLLQYEILWVLIAWQEQKKKNSSKRIENETYTHTMSECVLFIYVYFKFVDFFGIKERIYVLVFFLGAYLLDSYCYCSNYQWPCHLWHWLYCYWWRCWPYCRTFDHFHDASLTFSFVFCCSFVRFLFSFVLKTKIQFVRTINFTREKKINKFYTLRFIFSKLSVSLFFFSFCVSQICHSR